MTSGKTGIGVAELLETVVKQIPAPEGDPEAPLRALLFDSWYDSYRGAMMMLRVVDGEVKKGDKVKFMATGRTFEITEIGCFGPHPISLKKLTAGEVGFASASIKTTDDTKIGDTITSAYNGATEPLPGFEEVKPMVYAGLFPTDSADYEDLRDALAKLHLNDSSFTFDPDTSEALGFGFRCGFLGLLHMEIIQERVEREYHLDLITTAPSVVYRAHTKTGELILVDNPSKLPGPGELAAIEEPIVKVNIHVPSSFVGACVALCEERRGVQTGLNFHTTEHVVISYELPLGEVILDMHDRLKSATRGFASMDYEVDGYRENDLIKLDMLVNGIPLDALSIILHRDNAFYRGRALAAKLKELIPQQQYEVAIQAAVGAKIIARSTVRALRKDVTAKCYGGDISRKRKLLEKQKEGKKRMKSVGNVEVPQEAFLAVLRLEEN